MPTTTTQTRLDAYLAAEAAILQAQEFRGGDRTHRMAELRDVQAQIDRLQRQLNREQSGSGLRFSVANLSGE
tara:strand:+ start:414 stop:629 length:216 start_codon:yes stop_codon:yes gene_type:complete